jgi:hypothetical protein
MQDLIPKKESISMYVKEITEIEKARPKIIVLGKSLKTIKKADHKLALPFFSWLPECRCSRAWSFA